MNVAALYEVAPLETDSLAGLAVRIQQEHEATVAAIKSGVGHAIAAGKLLLEAKAQLKHGRWLPWLKDHCKVPARTAQLYMWLAEHDPNAQRVADLPLRRAVLKLQQLDRDARRQAEREQVAQRCPAAEKHQQNQSPAHVRGSGNGGDPETSAELMKAKHAEADDDGGDSVLQAALSSARKRLLDVKDCEAHLAKLEFKAGQALLELNKQVGNDDWRTFLKDNLPTPPYATIQRYMNLVE
jgi:hypothetical protein